MTKSDSNVIPFKEFINTNQNQKMIDENRNKSEFLASISHELRNPLSVIINSCDLLKHDERKVLNAEYLEYLNYIAIASEEILSLTNDLLDVSQANSGEFNVDLSKKIDLKNVAERAIILMKSFGLRRKIIIKHQIGENLPLINLDGRRIKQILVNLISNSIKYSPENTEILVSINLINNYKSLEMKIADQGFGMNKEELDLAIIRYKTIDNPNSGKVDAFGLGLPMVKQLVEAQKGRMEIKSEKNKGTIVKIIFDLSDIPN